MNIPIQHHPSFDRSFLTPEENSVLEKLQELAKDCKQEVDPEVISLANQFLKWSYDDPASLARAVYFMAHDPFLRREVEAIKAEFAAVEFDGLEDY